MMHFVDMLPTLAKLAGATTRSKPLDGIDVWPAIAGGKPSGRQEIVYNVEPHPFIDRIGRFAALSLHGCRIRTAPAHGMSVVTHNKEKLGSVRRAGCDHLVNQP
jgi:hypothetical protein